jgi:hypothetical protein
LEGTPPGAKNLTADDSDWVPIFPVPSEHREVVEAQPPGVDVGFPITTIPTKFLLTGKITGKIPAF